MTDAAQWKTPKSPRERTKSQGYGTEEIDVKPSTELIPDEYGHKEKLDLCIHVFGNDEDEDSLLVVKETALKLGCSFDQDRNMHSLEDVTHIRRGVELVRNDVDGKNALILFFVGLCDREGTLKTINEQDKTINLEIREIWNAFSPVACPQLKNKPKIFIFCTSTFIRETQIDGYRHYTVRPERVYDYPAESDILVIYKACDELDRHSSTMARYNFVRELCENISNLGHKHDIIDLMMFTQNEIQDNSQPLIISTLTRKFYMTSHDHREHFLSIVENTSELESALNAVKLEIERLRQSPGHTLADGPTKSMEKQDVKTKKKNIKTKVQKEGGKPMWKY